MSERLRTAAARWLRNHNPIDVFPMDTDELERRLVLVEEQAMRVMLTDVGLAVRYRHERLHDRAAFPCEACPPVFRKMAAATDSAASPRSPAMAGGASADQNRSALTGRHGLPSQKRNKVTTP